MNIFRVHSIIRPVGRGGGGGGGGGVGGSRGFARTPLLASKDLIYTALTVHFKCPTVGKWSTSCLAAIENHRCPRKAGCSYAGLFLEDQRRMRKRKLFAPL